MKKTILQLIEVLSLILLNASFVFFIKKIIDVITEYNAYQSIGLDFFIVVYSMGYILFLIILFFIMKIASRYLKNKGYFTLIGSFKAFSKKHRLVTIVSIVLFVITLFMISVILLQDNFIYHPNKSFSSEDRLVNSNKYLKIKIETENGTTLSGWLRLKDSKAYTIIYFGGNGESAPVFFSKQDSSDWSRFNDYNVIMVDYPGYGFSGGETNEESIYKMSLEVFDYVYKLDKIDNSKIIVFGFSLGTGVATYVAQKRNFNKLILLAPYTSMVDVFNSKVPIFYGLMELAFNNKFDSLNRAKDINEETLIICSHDDEVISYKLSKQLSEKIENVNLYYSDGSKHNKYLSNIEVILKINDFISN